MHGARLGCRCCVDAAVNSANVSTGDPARQETVTASAQFSRNVSNYRKRSICVSR